MCFNVLPSTFAAMQPVSDCQLAKLQLINVNLSKYENIKMFDDSSR